MGEDFKTFMERVDRIGEMGKSVGYMSTAYGALTEAQSIVNDLGFEKYSWMLECIIGQIDILLDKVKKDIDGDKKMIMADLGAETED